MNAAPLFLKTEVIIYFALWIIFLVLIRKHSFTFYFSILASVVFYVWFSGPKTFFLILILSLLTFLSGKTRNSFLLNFSILANFATILASKYIIANSASKIPQDLIPLGVSFFVFEFIHYLVEVKRGMNPEQNIANFLLFSFFSPTIVSGPIRRYPDFTKQLLGLGRPKRDSIFWGFLCLGMGFTYKFVADYFQVIQSRTYASRGWVELHNWIVMVIAIDMRIFLDFAGYSYIAIGIARLMNIEIPRNFRAPYLATSIIDFWNRWHISLSSWVRDYLYIPLGGSRVSALRRTTNLIAAMAVIGLWHGLGYRFLVWGVIQGVGLSLNHVFRKVFPRKQGLFSLILSFNKWLLTFIFVSIGWLFFFYEPSIALKILKVRFS